MQPTATSLLHPGSTVIGALPSCDGCRRCCCAAWAAACGNAPSSSCAGWCCASGFAAGFALMRIADVRPRCFMGRSADAFSQHSPVGVSVKPTQPS